MLHYDDPSFKRFQKDRVRHWDQIADKLTSWNGLGGYYQSRLAQVYKHNISAHLRVLELGCGDGSLLAALNPGLGVGIDFSEGMLQRGKAKHPHLHFIRCDAQHLCIQGTFDVIILSDLINELWDLQSVLKQLRPLTHARSRILINSYSRLWEIPLAVTEALNLAKPSLNLNWFTPEDTRNLLAIEDFEPIREWQEVLFPIRIPLLTKFFNRFLIRFWPFRHLALTNFIIARPSNSITAGVAAPSVSVVIPARNEAGNIGDIFERVPAMGAGTELIFVEGHSEDETYETIEKEIEAHPTQDAKLFRQIGEGKGDAVRLGFEQASGDILVILDADLTVPPEDLPRFIKILRSGKGDFVNGVRLVYPIEDQAMRYLNLIGNKLFSMTFSWLIGQTIKDTLCGTKVLWKRDYEILAKNRDYFGDLDPFGDFDLLLGAARLNLKIVDMPIRYRRRDYGQTNIRRWKHGWLLARMSAVAARKLKFA